MVLEALHPLIGDSCHLPFCWGIVHFCLFHGLYEPIDGGSTQDDWDSNGECAGLVQNEEDLIFIIVGHPFYLDPHQGKTQQLRLSTAEPY